MGVAYDPGPGGLDQGFDLGELFFYRSGLADISLMHDLLIEIG
jgi:hypothetical protein